MGKAGFLDGGKGDLLEGGIKIPCIVKIPQQKISEKSDEKFLLMDFYPSLIKLAAGKIDANLPSKKIQTIFGQKNETKRYMVWMRREGHKFGGRIYYAISDGEYKLLQKNPFSNYELYNLRIDPLEKNPIDFPEKYKLLKTKLTKHIQETGRIPWQ
jgi:arylsulfatase A-like enzyme